MMWNPYVNALGAAGYIWCVGFLMHYISAERHDTPDKFTDPVIALSVLVLSAATMAFFFFYYPVVLLIEHKFKEASHFFLKTLITFGVVTVLTVIFVL
jgi:hypothetical protein